MENDETVFVWTVDGKPHTGTLLQYVQHWKNNQYSSDLDLSQVLLTWDGEGQPVIHRLKITRDSAQSGDYIRYTFEVPGLPDTAWAHINALA